MHALSRQSRPLLSLAVVASLLGIRSIGGSPLSPSPAHASRASVVNLSTLPLAFEVNRGQTNGRVRFLARAHGATLFLTAHDAVLTLPEKKGRGSAVRLHPLGESSQEPVGETRLPGTVNYFVGKHRWTNIPTFQAVRYPGVYPHTDLRYYGHAGQLEYDWVLHPGADPAAIRLRVDGERRLHVDRYGNLLITHESSVLLRQARPVVYQVIGGKRLLVSGRYALDGRNIVRFVVGPYDHSRTLIVDPVLSYLTTFGGRGDDVARSISVDGQGNAYITGYTTSSVAFPQAYAWQWGFGGATDAFITKLSPDGKTMVYSTYLGGSGDDEATGIVVDPSGTAYISGFTNSTDFPGQTDRVSTHGGYDAFAVSVCSSGGLLFYLTLMGDGQDQYGTGIAIDNAGDAFVSAKVADASGGTEAAMYSLLPSGAIAASRVFGGDGKDGATGIGVDSFGNAWLTGVTGGAGFQTSSGAVQSGYQGGDHDAFLTEIVDALGKNGPPTIGYSTYLGSPGDDEGTGITVDPANNIYVTGYTNGTGHSFPSTNSLQSGSAGGYDAFITKFATMPAVSRAWSTLYGGKGDDRGEAIAVDTAGQVIVAGSTASTDFGTSSAVQPAYGGGADDAFVLKTTGGQNGLTYSTYLGGTGDDRAYGVAADSNGNVYIAGSSDADSFYAAGDTQDPGSGGTDAFAAKVQDSSGMPGFTSPSTTTPTATDIPAPTSTSTQVPTSTQTPASTAMPTSTPTPLPPTATPTSTVVPPPLTPVIDLTPSSPIAGENMKIMVSTSPGAQVNVSIRVRAGGQTLYQILLTGKSKPDGRFGRTRRFRFFPARPIKATATVYVATAGGTASKTLKFTVRPASAARRAGA